MIRTVFFSIVFAGCAVAAQAGVEGRVEVVDADTIRVGGETVRLFGIDAPEIGQPCILAGQERDCGVWAARAVAQEFGGAYARCDDRGQDRYGRQIAKCSVNGTDMGATLVISGLAQAFTRYSTDYVDIEKQAIVARRGIWAGQMDSPSDYRRGTTQAAADGAPNGCTIKGNISGNGRIYHMPGQENYGRTRISTDRGERWFCSEAEARAAGWRAARR